MGLRWFELPEALVVVFEDLISEVNADWGVIAGFLQAPFALVDLTAQGSLLQRLIEIEVIDAPAAIAVPSA